MSNIITAKVSIKGTRPIFWHRFGPDAMPLEKKEKTGVAGHDPEEWKRTVLVTGDRHQLYIDGAYVFSCAREGARYTKRGRGSLQVPVSATLQVAESIILIDDRFLPNGFTTPPPTDPTLPVYLDVRGVRNPATKGRNVRYRIACSTGWSCAFTLQWDKTIVSRGEMEAVLIDSGRLCGIGNGRAIGFGRFSVEHFEVADA